MGPVVYWVELRKGTMTAIEIMAENIYLFGAGVNKVIEDRYGITPPFANDVFQVAAKLPRLFDYVNYQPLYDYIQQIWHYDKSYLAGTPFNLEECFTLLYSQFKEALNRNDKALISQLATLRLRFSGFLAELLSYFTPFVSVSAMDALGDILYSEKPTIITFNYDTFLESAIESASDLNATTAGMRYPSESNDSFMPTSDELIYSHFNWNRPLGYFIKFDEVKLHRAGITTMVPGSKFYAEPANKPYHWPILKLHGSLNWFHYLPVRRIPAQLEGTENALPEDKRDAKILVDGNWWLGDPPTLGDWYIEPIIVPPVLYKDDYESESGRSSGLNSNELAPQWEKAKEALSDCKSLTIVGYSFPPTDFATKKLFLEAFADHQVEELTIVNPNGNVVETIKGLCHFPEPIVCGNLPTFLGLKGISPIRTHNGKDIWL
jgi:hypothetical protein